jgi:redox-sensing transcriptional repressor
MSRIRIAVAGIGNCASSLVQGIAYYASHNSNGDGQAPGLMHAELGGYRVEDISVVAAFDIDPKRPRNKKITQPILHIDAMPALVRERNVRMAILSVPASVAQEVANQLVQVGIAGILNFAPIVLSVPEEVTVNNVNLAIELENLSYFVQN